MPLKFKELTGLWMLVVFFVLVSLGVSAANNQNIDYSFTHAPPGNCFKATPNHGGILQWLVDVQNNGPGRMHIVSAAFHDPHSGCGATTYSPSGGWHVGGTTGYYEGGSGHTSFTYDLNSKNCGRVQVDAGFRDDNDEDIVFIGYVIDYGVNCNSNSNHEPVVTSCTTPSSIALGSAAKISYSISDPDGDSFTVAINWGDGTTTSGGSSSATHVYSSPGTYTVSGTVTDSKGASFSGTCGTITVTHGTVNHPPTISSCSPSSSTVSPGGTVGINYAISDSEGDSFSVTVNWGDGTINSGGQSSATHTYNSPGTYTVSITATDSKGESSTRSCGTITVSSLPVNHPPTISTCSPSSSPVVVGSVAAINYVISDPESNSFTVMVNWGDGTTSSGSSSAATHTYTSTGTFTVTITATDSLGDSSSRSCSSIVVVPMSGNHPPEISSCTSPSTSIVGTTATIHYSVSDPDADTFSVTINWGDGSSSSGGPFSAAHIYLAAGTYFVTVTATDSRGASSSRNCGQIIVIPTGGNHPPIISSCTPPSTVTIGTTATINYIISDPDGDPFTVLVNWGDGTTTSGGQSSSTHTYTSTGTFSVTITVTDSRGASTGSFCGSIMVTDGESNPSSGSKLKIIDVDVKVDGRTSSGLSDGEKISRTAGPESKIDFKIKTRNLFSTTGGLTIRNIVVKTTIESIDNGDDLEDESSDFDLRPQSEKTVTLNNFKLPLNVDDSDYNVHIEAEGEDENGTTQRDELNIVLEVKKDKHDLRFTKLVVNKAKINCNEGFMLNYQIINLGREDEEKSYVEIKSDELGIDSFQRDIEIQSGTDGNTYSKIVPLKILNNVEDGSYPLTVNIYSDDGTLQDTKTVQLNVQDCGVKKQINQTTTNTLSSVNSNLFGTETVEKTIQIPFIQLFFRGAGGGLFWILISTLILSIFFVLAAIILMAGRDEEDY